MVKIVEQKNSDDKPSVVGIFVVIFFIIVIIFSIYTIFDIGGSDITDGQACTGNKCYKAETYALEDIPEIALVWETVKANELTCEGDYITDDQITMVRCNTTNDEIISYFESSEIWYGFLESADGRSYFRYADANKNVVLDKLRE